MKTHLRMDALMFGVLLSWLWHVCGVPLCRVSRPWRILMGFVGVSLLSVPFVYDVSTWGRVLNVYAYNGFYVGSGLVLLAGLGGVTPKTAIRPLVRIGACSYTVYLCHLPWQKYFVLKLIEPSESSSHWWVYFVLYVGGSVVAGSLLSKWLEAPCLRMRDRWFPSRSGGSPALA